MGQGNEWGKEKEGRDGRDRKKGGAGEEKGKGKEGETRHTVISESRRLVSK